MSRGDEMAYRTFYDLYFNRLLRYLLVVTRGDEDAAREALQQTLLRVVRHVRPFDSEPVFWSWLTVLARSSIVDEERKRRRYLSFLDRFFQGQQIEASAAADGTDAHLLALLEKHLATLAEHERELVEQKYFATASVKEIAADCEQSEKAVESRLVRIRKKLREAILAELKHESRS
ncbi:MAG: sigma-70 family RNA polymerase sigma factor [Verrucomicrobia bacterium]|nr:sigma-70 family RNA polymerase sigma factor [Verrucomicrobiota bacterium]